VEKGVGSLFLTKRDEARAAFDALLSEPVEATWPAGRHRTKRLHDAEEQLAEAELHLAAVQGKFTKAVDEIRTEIREVWLERARTLFEDFRRKAEALEAEHEQLKEISVIGERLLHMPYHISFKAFCKTNGGECPFSHWCSFVERELKPARSTLPAGSLRCTPETDLRF
jgi:hypothetical protein